MPNFHSRSSLGDVLSQPHARAVIEQIAPEVLESALAQPEASFPLGPVLSIILDPSDVRVQVLLDRLFGLEDRTEHAVEPGPIAARLDYEGVEITRASAKAQLPQAATVNHPAELVFSGPSHGNPFVDVELCSGDLLVFGREQRRVFHGVPRVAPGTAPAGLGLPPGRLSITVRETGFA